MEDVPKLPDEHLEKAKEIISSHSTRKNCNRCYGRGYQGVDQNNMAMLCHKCVDQDKVTEEWRAYVRATPALVELYGDYFEADEEEAQEAAPADSGKHGSPMDPKSAHRAVQDGPHTHAGSQHHRGAAR